MKSRKTEWKKGKGEIYTKNKEEKDDDDDDDNEQKKSHRKNSSSRDFGAQMRFRPEYPWSNRSIDSARLAFLQKLIFFFLGYFPGLQLLIGAQAALLVIMLRHWISIELLYTYWKERRLSLTQFSIYQSLNQWPQSALHLKSHATNQS